MKVHDSSGNTVTTNTGRHQLTREAPPIGGFMYYLDAVKNMMAEMKMNRKLMDKMKMDVENDMDEFMDA